ncbi:MAG: MerR family transcriptional regulator [Bdellovibrionales bacterium]|nr:MerR family transcriptional regulator [Bdellovibrionales bacterium]
MKNWLRIGQFAKKSGLSPRALRIYEELGILCSHSRGQNGYRYYEENQLELAFQIKKFKTLGFTLDEIKALLEVDLHFDSNRLKSLLSSRLQRVCEMQEDLSMQKSQLENILTSLENSNKCLKQDERRYIMSQFKKVSVVVTGIKDIEATASEISKYLSTPKEPATIILWEEDIQLPVKKPFIVVLPENSLQSKKVKEIEPDVVVIKNLSQYSKETEEAYINLYSAVGPHMTTVFNADDSLSVKLAGNNTIRKGRTFYFSKNKGLEDQIKRIGGVVSDGEDITLFGFNLKKDILKYKLNTVLGFDKEVSLLASLTAVLDIGLDKEILDKQFCN